MINKLVEKIKKTNAPIVVGLDPMLSYVPEHIQKKVISGKNAFNLYETYGFPLELTIEMAHEKNFEVDEKGFAVGMQKALPAAGSASRVGGKLIRERLFLFSTLPS